MKPIIDKEKLLSWAGKVGVSKKFEKFYSQLSIPKDLKLKNMDLSSIQKICSKVNGERKKSSNVIFTKNSPNEIIWRIGEYKLFIWVCSLYTYNNQISINEMAQTDFQFLNTLFTEQNPTVLRHQLLCIFPPKAALKKQWGKAQIKMLKDIIINKQKTLKKISWKQVSFQLYLYSDKQYFRTNVKCREMWNNHLSPTLNKNTWTIQQDLLLFSALQEEDRCWAKISKRFKGTRNQHMIKNRYIKITNNYNQYNQHLSRKQRERTILKYLILKQKKNLKEQIKSAQNSQSYDFSQIIESQQENGVQVNQKTLLKSQINQLQLFETEPNNNIIPLVGLNLSLNYNLQEGQIKFQEVYEYRPRKLFDQGLQEMLDQSQAQFIEESFYQPERLFFQLQQ